MKLRAIIADDEVLARERVRALLADQPDIEVVAECADGAAAVTAVEQHQPELLFLDVQMPRLNGFEVLETLKEPPRPVVIFTTAYDQHAVRAFEVSAVDYLLKPFKQARFRKALDRARAQLQARHQPGLEPRLTALLTHWRAGAGPGPRLLVKSPDRILFLRLPEIDHVEADGNYVQIHSGKERHMIRETMAAMEARLTPAGFMRISRSTIVNLARIRELQPVGSGDYCVILFTGERLNMTCPLREMQERLSQV